jgi:hypothetical protein
MNKEYIESMKLTVIFVLFFLVFAFSSNMKQKAIYAQTRTTVTVDFTKPLHTLSPLAIGIDESGYGQPNVLTNDPLQRQRLAALKPTYMRMNLKYSVSGDPTSKIVCGGSGCATDQDGDAWITAIKGIGAEPLIEDPVNPGDLPNLVRHFNLQTNNHVSYWLGGINEPNLNGQDATTYSNAFNTTYDAMKAVDPTIKIGGPTVAWYDPNFLQTFLTISGSRVDFLDFHGYAQGTTQLTYDQLFAKSAKYETDINNLRAKIVQTVPNRASQIEIQIGEYDLDYTGHLLEYTQFATAWVASALGHILKADGIALLYADKGNALFKTDGIIPGGLLDDPTAIYHALGMYTGESLFPHFGDTVVTTAVSDPTIEVFASNNPKQIIVINKSPDLTIDSAISLIGVTSGMLTVWQKNQTLSIIAPPVNLGNTALSNGQFVYSFPPFSVTTFVINSGSNGPTPTPVRLIGDANSDGRVDALDSKLLLQKWLQPASSPIDQNGDGKVNGFDFVVVAGHMQ